MALVNEGWLLLRCKMQGLIGTSHICQPPFPPCHNAQHTYRTKKIKAKRGGVSTAACMCTWHRYSPFGEGAHVYKTRAQNTYRGQRKSIRATYASLASRKTYLCPVGCRSSLSGSASMGINLLACVGRSGGGTVTHGGTTQNVMWRTGRSMGAATKAKRSNPTAH